MHGVDICRMFRDSCSVSTIVPAQLQMPPSSTLGDLQTRLEEHEIFGQKVWAWCTATCFVHSVEVHNVMQHQCIDTSGQISDCAPFPSSTMHSAFSCECWPGLVGQAQTMPRLQPQLMAGHRSCAI